MSKFNLKNYKKSNGDEHTSRGLSQQHSKAPEVITEKQLQKSHVDEKNVITEKQLDSVRQDEAPMTIEGRLNSAKGRFEIKHRNEEASSGNINKVEEKRIATSKNEDEKYESASSIPSAQRWWEKNKKKDDLKVASVIEQMRKLAQITPEEDLEETDTQPTSNKTPLTDDRKRFERLDGMWNTMEDGVSEENVENEFVGKPSKEEDFDVEDDEDLGLGVSKELFVADKRENMPKGLNPYTFYASIGYDPMGWKNQDELEQAVVEMVLKIRPDLDGKISTENLGKPKQFGDRGYYPFRLVGDEYVPSSGSEEVEAFSEASFETTDVGGTPTYIGKININGDPANIDDETISQDIADFINEKHSDLNVSPESIVLDTANMEATFAVARTSMTGQIDRMPDASDEGDENFPVDEAIAETPTATEDFPVQVEAELPKTTAASSKNLIRTLSTKKK